MESIDQVQRYPPTKYFYPFGDQDCQKSYLRKVTYLSGSRKEILNQEEGITVPVSLSGVQIPLDPSSLSCLRESVQKRCSTIWERKYGFENKPVHVVGIDKVVPSYQIHLLTDMKVGEKVNICWGSLSEEQVMKVTDVGGDLVSVANRVARVARLNINWDPTSAKKGEILGLTSYGLVLYTAQQISRGLLWDMKYPWQIDANPYPERIVKVRDMALVILLSVLPGEGANVNATIEKIATAMSTTEVRSSFEGKEGKLDEEDEKEREECGDLEKRLKEWLKQPVSFGKERKEVEKQWNQPVYNILEPNYNKKRVMGWVERYLQNLQQLTLPPSERKQFLQACMNTKGVLEGKMNVSPALVDLEIYRVVQGKGHLVTGDTLSLHSKVYFKVRNKLLNKTDKYAIVFRFFNSDTKGIEKDLIHILYGVENNEKRKFFPCNTREINIHTKENPEDSDLEFEMLGLEMFMIIAEVYYLETKPDSSVYFLMRSRPIACEIIQKQIQVVKPQEEELSDH